MTIVKENLPFIEEEKRKPVVTVELLIAEYDEEINGLPEAWNNLVEMAPQDALGITNDGFPVYDRPNSHLHQEMTPLWREALSLVHLGWDKVKSDYQNWQQQVEQNPNLRKSGLSYILDVDFGRQIGESTSVETSGRDQIIFAVRQKRLGYTRFVAGRRPHSTSHTTLIIRLDERRMQAQLDSPAFISVNSKKKRWVMGKKISISCLVVKPLTNWNLKRSEEVAQLHQAREVLAYLMNEQAELLSLSQY